MGEIDHSHYMNQAYQEALKAFDESEVPIGAVIVRDNKVIGRGYNRMEGLTDATAHAEIIAIGAAASASQSWRLNGCTIYITLEPCLMCLGAIMQSRIDAIVYACAEKRIGAIDSFCYRHEVERAYFRFPRVVSGVMEHECSALITSFFKKIRPTD